jgi:hypothetical protein
MFQSTVTGTPAMMSSGKRKEESLFGQSQMPLTQASSGSLPRFPFPGSFDTFNLTPFSKASSSPSFFMDGSESEVSDIFDSRCSSADTSKESLFSPSAGRCRSLSSGGSKKSPRNSHSCSPASQFFSYGTDDEGTSGRDSVGSVSKKFNNFHMQDASSPRSLSVSETIMEDESEYLVSLPNFFSPKQQASEKSRGRADSFSDEADYNVPPEGMIHKPCYECSPQVYVDERDSMEEPMKSFKEVLPFQPHMQSVFSPHPSLSGSDSFGPPPLSEALSPPDACVIPTRLHRSVSLSGITACMSETLNFGDSCTAITTMRPTDQKQYAASTSSSRSMMSFTNHVIPDTARQRHPSVNPKLCRGKTEPAFSSKKRNSFTETPLSPPPMERTMSQCDEYLPQNNPRCFNDPVTTPQGPQNRSYTTCGEVGNDWGITTRHDSDDLKCFFEALRIRVEGPRVSTESSMKRDIFSSVSSAFDSSSI